VRRELDAAESAEVTGELGDLDARASGIAMKVTVSASSAASARPFGPRTAITTGVCRSGPRPSLSTESECASHAVVQAGRTGEAYIQVPTRISAISAARASVGHGAGCHPGTSGISSVE
jgi:hypothetical protein